jgi:hypothetical protein
MARRLFNSAPVPADPTGMASTDGVESTAGSEGSRKSRWASKRLLGSLLAVTVVGVVASGCDWPQFLYGPDHTGFNPTETAITTTNVGTLVQRFSGNAGTSLTGDPVVAGGMAYVGGSNTGLLYAFSASAASGCAGSPAVCSPVWTARVGPANTGVGDPATANGVVYVADANGTLAAFDAAGKTNCSGSPVVCSPLWSTSAGPGFTSSPVYANGVIYLTSANGLEAFDATGTTNCVGTPKVCSPLWTTSVPGTYVSISNGIAYLSGSGADPNTIYALDATGASNCGGTPKVCSPLWQLQTELPTLEFAGDYPVISDGTVFIATASPYQPNPAALHYNIEAFDASGTVNCSGVPKTCAPVWTTSDFPTVLQPAVGNDTLYVTSLTNGTAAFDAKGVKNCSGTPVVCSPLWTSSVGAGGGFWTPTVAGGVAFLVSPNHLYALDAGGKVGCSASVCSPLWTSPTSSFSGSSLAVANGLVYIVGSDGRLHVYGLP